MRRQSRPSSSADHAGVGVRRLPQDARSGRRAVSGLLEVRRACTAAEGGLVQGHVAAGFEGEVAATRRTVACCNGSASGQRRTPGSPSPWSSTFTTFSLAARCCYHPKRSMIRSFPPSVGRIRSSVARLNRSQRGSLMAGFNLKVAFKEWMVSDFYRADGLAQSSRTRGGRELDDIGRDANVVAGAGRAEGRRGVRRTLGQAQRPARATVRWDRFQGSDGACHRPQRRDGCDRRILSNDVACKNVGRDFALPPAERRLFPGIEPA